MIIKIYSYKFWNLFIGDGEFCQEFLKKTFSFERQQYFLLLDEDNKTCFRLTPSNVINIVPLLDFIIDIYFNLHFS